MKFCPWLFKKSSNGASKLGISLLNPYTCTNNIFNTKLQSGENQMMSKEIINFKLEKI